MRVGDRVGPQNGMYSSTQDAAWANRKKVIIGGVVALVLILALSVWGMVRQMMYSVTIDITVAPAVAKVMLDGREYAATREYKIQPGEYEVVVTAEGFETKTGRLVAVAGERVEIALYLEPTAENANWYLEHPEDARTMGDIKSDEAARAVEELTRKHPILAQLPLMIDYYTDGYARRVKYTISYLLTNENRDFVITVTDYTGGNYADALDKLRARGVVDGQYEVQYEDVSGEEWGHA